MSEIRAVIFDLYGTLIDIRTSEEKEEIFYYLSLYLQYYGANMDEEKLKSALDLEKEQYLKTKHERYPELDLEMVFKNILKKEGLDSPFLAESCCKIYRLLTRERFGLFPDSLPVLKEMKREGHPLAVVSDAQKVFSLEEVKILGLDGFFNHIILSTHFGFKKPDPRLFSIACALLEVPPTETVYIGDNLKRDVKGAKRIGMQVILVDRNQKEEKEEIELDFYANNLWEAWKWIKKRKQA